MKKFFQISLIAVLVFVLFQAAAGGSVISSGQVDLSAASSISSEANTFADGVQMAVCLATIKGVNCVMPNVGWNS
jgi:hypothetical protein